MQQALEKWFRIHERGSSWRAELIGGITTFMTMGYIIIVNPAILSFAGFPHGPATMATILTAVFGCTLMGIYANLPIAVAPYMGENAFIAFGLSAMHATWQQCLGAVFISGLAFALMSVIRVRPWLANSISPSMKYSFAAGIGLFLTLVGAYQTGIVTSAVTGMPAEALTVTGSHFLRAPDVPLKIGNFHDPHVLLAILGFVLISVMQYRRIHGAILIGIGVTAILGFVFGIGRAPEAIVAMPFQGDFSLAPLAFHLDVVSVLTPTFFPVLLTLFLMSFLDTLGTLVGVGSAGNMLDEKGNFPEIEKPMIVDSVSCVFSSLVGSSTSGAFIESATGIREGARTGIAALVCAALFAVSLFFVPLIEPLQYLNYAYAPALMAVGLLMLGSITKVDLTDATEAVPAFATIVLMLFSYNIANGLTGGLVLYPIFKFLCGRGKELHPGSIVLAGMCLIYFLYGIPH